MKINILEIEINIRVNGDKSFTVSKMINNDLSNTIPLFDRIHMVAADCIKDFFKMIGKHGYEA